MKVWHDADADIRDREVIQKVAPAINQSRFIVACVSKGFSESIWCRAEFLPSLELEKHIGINRVIVALLDRNSKIPFELSSVPIFDVSVGSIDKLSKYLQSHNELPFLTSTACKQKSLFKKNQLEELLNHCQSVLDELPEGFGNLETEKEVCAALAWAVVESSNIRGFSNPLYGLRCMLYEKGDNQFRNYSDKFISLIENASLWFAQSDNVDNRANAMYLLVWLAKERVAKQAINLIFEILRFEENNSVIRIAINFLSKANFRKTKKRLSVTALSALRDPYGWNLYSKSKTFNLLPESIRLFVLKGKGLNEEILSMEERLFLIRQRLEYLLESETNYLSDTEITFRELYELLFEYRKPRNFNNDQSKIYSLVCDMISEFVQQSSIREGKPLIFMAEYAVDFLLPLLLVCLKEEELIKKVRSTYQRICKIFQKYSSYGNEVPAYKLLFENVKKGMSINEAMSNYDFLNLMQKATDYRRSQNFNY